MDHMTQAGGGRIFALENRLGEIPKPHDGYPQR